MTVGGERMSISRSNILKQMERELIQAQLHVHHDGQLKQHIARMTMLCDLILETEVGKDTHETPNESLQHKQLQLNEQTHVDEVNHSSEDPYDIFDF